MIPVRVPADLKVTLATDRVFDMKPGHPLSHSQCPVCDQFPMNHRCVLVFAGIAPDDRKPAGFTAGAAVAVHEACAVGEPAEALPGWEEMSDLDKGAVLLFRHKVDYEGKEYATDNYPCRYFDHPALLALTLAQACEHADSLDLPDDGYEGLGEAEYERLYNLALDADRSRMSAENAAGEPA